MRILILTVFVLLNGSLFAQQCHGFLPNQKGTVWEITTFNARDKEIGKAHYELIDLVEKNGSTTYTVKVLSKIGRKNDTHENIYTATCKDGKFEFDIKLMMNGMSMKAYENMETDIDATALEMPQFDATSGTKLKDGSIKMDVKDNGTSVYHLEMHITEREVEKHEKKETPVGTYDCIQIKQHIKTVSFIPIDMVTKEWYADGIGLVASEVYTAKGKLASYTKLTSLDIK